jgi:hypothetical protein
MSQDVPKSAARYSSDNNLHGSDPVAQGCTGDAYEVAGIPRIALRPRSSSRISNQAHKQHRLACERPNKGTKAIDLRSFRHNFGYLVTRPDLWTGMQRRTVANGADGLRQLEGQLRIGE